jgi:Ca-activated chloride channel family protein
VSVQSPLLLLTLAVPALALAAYVWLERRPSRYAVDYPNLAVLAAVASRSHAWRRHVTAALVLLALAALCTAVARPQMTMSVPDERATVILTLDVSGSMMAEDVKPNRLAAARAAIERFLESVPKRIRVGLILFSSEPTVVAPPTRDHELVKAGLGQLVPGFGTAIGDSVARSAELARETTDHPEAGAPPPSGVQESPPAVVVFLSDGFQTRGIFTPGEGARRAARARVPVHTIALGTDEGVIELERYGEQRQIPVPPDREALAEIASVTGGKSFDVRDAGRLSEVYGNLGSLVGRVDEEREVTVGFVAAGAALLAAAGMFAGLWLPRLP